MVHLSRTHHRRFDSVKDDLTVRPRGLVVVVLVTARAAAILLLVVFNIARMLVVRELGRAVDGGVSFTINLI